MPIYLLTPRHLQAPDWKLSTQRKAVQIEAASEDEARQCAAKLYCTPAASAARVNPWTQSTLTRAKAVAAADLAVPFKRSTDAL